MYNRTNDMKELNAKIVFYPSGSYEIMIEEDKESNLFVEASAAELKQLAEAYAASAKKTKEQLKKDVETSKKIGKKAVVKAFLKKAIEKKRKQKKITSKELFKEQLADAKTFLKGFTKGWEKEENSFSSYRGDWKAMKNDYFLSLQSANYADKRIDSATEAELTNFQGKLIKYFEDEYLMYDKTYRYSDAPEEFIKLLKGVIKAGDNYVKGKDTFVKVYEEFEVKPPYSSDLSEKGLRKLLALFDGADYDTDEEVKFYEEEAEDNDDEERVYDIAFFAKFVKPK